MMKHLYLFITLTIFALSSPAWAQEDDMYFTPTRLKKTKNASKEQVTRQIQVIYEDETPLQQSAVRSQPQSVTRDVDEYNRRSRSSLSSVTVDTLTFNEESQTYQLSAQSLYDLGYTEGYSQGYSDADDFDFYYATRLARFHGGHYYSPWYWSHVSYIYNPWHWDPWFYDPWYRPYYYGGWYSVGWGIGYCGSYWNPYWPAYHSFYPHHHHHYWGHANIHTPRISTVRNRDYGRSRIVSRTSRVGEQGRTNRGTTLGSGQQTRRSDASSRFTERSASRSTRVTDRSQRSTTTNRSTSNTVRRNSERTNTTQQRSSSSSTMRSNSNTRMSERNNSRMGGSMGSSSRGGGMGGGTFTGGGSRSGGGSRGGGRGR